MRTTAVILDTNLFLHFRSFDQIDWCCELEAERVDLIVPIKVVDELDQKKTDKNKTKQKRARNAIKKIEHFTCDQSGIISDSINIKYAEDISSDWLINHGFDINIVDHHIIATAIQLSNTSLYDRLLIYSDDSGMRARATMKQINVVRPSDSIRLPDEVDEIAKENENLKNELNKMKSRFPKLRILVNGNQNVLMVKPEEPVGLTLRDIDDKLMDVKSLYPKVDFKKRQQKEQEKLAKNVVAGDLLKLMAGFKNPFDPGEKEWEEYNSKLAKYYENFETYLRDKNKYENRARRTLFLTFSIENFGTAPASDTDIWLHFPDGFALSRYRDWPDEPQEPTPPSEPKNLMLQMASPLSPIAFGENLIVRQPNFHVEARNVSAPTIRETNSYEATSSAKLIKHCTVEQLDRFCLEFEDFRSFDSFTIDYRLHCRELLEPVEGKFRVQFE